MAAEQKIDPSAPRVLILGACGFIGRNLVKYISDNNLASFVKAVDKRMPMIASLNAEHKAAFERKELVKFQQADLSREAHAQKAFNEDQKFDFVVNLCGETRCGMTEEDYNTKCVLPAAECGKAAAAHGVKKWVEVSTAQVYESDRKASTEDSKIAPWTLIAKYRLMAEEAVKAVNGLPVVTLRPAIVYGPGDLTGLSPRVCCAAVYKEVLKKKMKFLWASDLQYNVVHVNDVCSAIWTACTELAAGSVYNLADDAGLDQGTLNSYLGSIFGIQTGFHGSIKSNLAKLNLSGVAEMANDQHMPGWSEMCRAANILNTPLSPYIDAELLRNNHLSVSGAKITQDSGFTYKHQVSAEAVRAQIDDFIAQGVFPPIL